MKPERHHIETYQSEPRPTYLKEVGRRGLEPPAVRAPEARPHELSSPQAAEEPLRCVWSGYPNYDRDCRSRIPTSVVVKAWQRERQIKGTLEGFFYFEWRSGMWLAYGAKNGGVRGVYCPTHCSERDSRTPIGTPQCGGHLKGHTPKGTGRQTGEVRVEDRRGNQTKGVALQ